MIHINKFNESLRDKMTPKSKEEIITSMGDDGVLLYGIVELCEKYWESKGVVFNKEYKSEEFHEEFGDYQNFFRMYNPEGAIVTPKRAYIVIKSNSTLYAILLGDVDYIENVTYIEETELLMTEIELNKLR